MWNKSVGWLANLPLHLTLALSLMKRLHFFKRLYFMVTESASEGVALLFSLRCSESQEPNKLWYMSSKLLSCGNIDKNEAGHAQLGRKDSFLVKFKFTGIEYADTGKLGTTPAQV